MKGLTTENLIVAIIVAAGAGIARNWPSHAAPPPAPVETAHKVVWVIAATSLDGQTAFTTKSEHSLPGMCQGMVDMLNSGEPGKWFRYRCVLTLKPPLAQSASAPVT